MNQFDKTKETIEKIFKQAQEGKIEFAGWKYYVKFNTNIEGKLSGQSDEHITINIPDYDLFIAKVARYLKSANKFYSDEKKYYELDGSAFDEKMVMCLFLNMSFYDSQNVYNYIDVKTKMLDANLTIEKNKLGNLFYLKGGENKKINVNMWTKKNLSNLEAPYKMCFNMSNADGEKFALPAVTFGLANNKCYVYAVQQTKEASEGQLVKDLDRYLRKVNKCVNQEDIIANVSPSFLVSLTLFCSQMKEMGIKQIIAKDFLPMRYMAVVDAPGACKERLEKLDRDQVNMTDKFMYLFLRYSHHFPSCQSNYNVDSGEMVMDLNQSNEKQDNIIYQFDEIGKTDEIEKL